MLRLAWILVLASMALCTACSSIRVPQETNVVTMDPNAIPEQELLDIDIRLFSELPEPDFTAHAEENAAEMNLQALRKAESHYLSRLLAEGLQRSGHWGSVRLNPYGFSSADLEVVGEITQSDGHRLRLRVEARDSRGTVWFSRQYLQILDTETTPRGGVGTVINFPFSSLLNTIANDLASARSTVVHKGELAAIRNTSTLKFAASLVPEVYAPYLEANGIIRLPAQDDPLFLRVQEIRARNEIFLDAMQQSYLVYIKQIAPDYLRFLDRSLKVTMLVDDYFEEKDIVRGKVNSGPFRSVYSRALVTSNQPIEEVVAPLTIEFSDHTAQLSGSVENQFRQWEQILLDMYRLETRITDIGAPGRSR